MTGHAPIVFERPVRIRFAHCDPAGIVFFPQYLTLTNVLVEDWFTEALRVDYAEMIGKRRVGFLLSSVERFFAPPDLNCRWREIERGLIREGWDGPRLRNS